MTFECCDSVLSIGAELVISIFQFVVVVYSSSNTIKSCPLEAVISLLPLLYNSTSPRIFLGRFGISIVSFFYSKAIGAETECMPTTKGHFTIFLFTD